MILLSNDTVWQIDEEIVRKALGEYMNEPKGKLKVKDMCNIMLILRKFTKKAEVPALLKLRGV